MTAQASRTDWLQRYATNYHCWRTIAGTKQTFFKRPHGLTEGWFSWDGDDYQGRADLTFVFNLEVSHDIGYGQLIRRAILAWANLRLQHVMLMAKITEEGPDKQRWFVIQKPEGFEEALRDAEMTIGCLKERDSPLDLTDFLLHASNTGRLLNSKVSLSKLFVASPERLSQDKCNMKFAFAMGHEITDGMSAYNWLSHFIRLLNTSEQILLENVDKFRTQEQIKSRLPPAQEDLYLEIPGNKARQLWFWAILRVLRHVRKPLPACFVNPLRKETRSSQDFEPKYQDILDYSRDRKPPNNSGYVLVVLSKLATDHIKAITRESGGTIGAACFALVALSMMELEEERHPDVRPADRKPMIMSFPMNPKPYFGYTKQSESCMLSFGDNFLLPFLPSDLERTGRFRLLLKQCQIKLSLYQKRIRSPSGKLSLAAYSPSRLLANASLATNGVSNVGSTRQFFEDVAHQPAKEASNDLNARLTFTRGGVRARDGEFLVGSSTDVTGLLSFGVSYDASWISDGCVAEWKKKMESLLLPEVTSRL
ncbi:hypothetical protein EJ05DRAFT_469179 [Pseudovirgaria hyperparasitica]|uniref:CoA-dependent acyltransferase n=1 Tax=Pseudovirgaria hyperparasitica TaxID=470096 RepID=A0A6A6VV89_9PEZI|nr:uncharacterized protein EJ05DRAFT_469179 [Pseudovirgaria hyperparasitica]KAF2754085.1 hypothetical protein EJ05DRAFT_469179 [Pseudovirgaria hyperparasitica]